MITQLLTALIRWLATHLVAFTLLGFLTVGLHFAGIIDLSRVVGADAVEVAMPGGDPAGPAGGRSQATDPLSGPPDSEPASETGRAAVNGGPLRPVGPAGGGPRLIGGILPVEGAATGREGDFRPSEQEPPSADEAPGDYLQVARRAYWNGDFEASEAAYMALIGEAPGDGNAFGELGNLYQSMNRPGLALDAYFEAGVRFRAAGDREKLHQIIEVLKQQGDERAHDLNR